MVSHEPPRGWTLCVGRGRGDYGRVDFRFDGGGKLAPRRGCMDQPENLVTGTDLVNRFPNKIVFVVLVFTPKKNISGSAVFAGIILSMGPERVLRDRLDCVSAGWQWRCRRKWWWWWWRRYQGSDCLVSFLVLFCNGNGDSEALPPPSPPCRCMPQRELAKTLVFYRDWIPIQISKRVVEELRMRLLVPRNLTLPPPPSLRR